MNLGRLEEALSSWDESIERFEAFDSTMDIPIVLGVLVGKGTILTRLGRLEEALEVWDDHSDAQYTASTRLLIKLASPSPLSTFCLTIWEGRKRDWPFGTRSYNSFATVITLSMSWLLHTLCLT